MDANKVSTISKAATDEAIGAFWDEHDFTDFDDPNAPDVEFEFTCAVPIERQLFTAIERQAQRRGVMIETLVNLWLQEKLLESSSPKASV